MAREPDWKALAIRLSKPWWGPPPESYVFKHKGKTAGVGLIVEQDYGHWNLMLLAKQNFHNPQTVEEHGKLVELFVQTKIAYSDVIIAGQGLGSYTMLMSVPEFSNWIRGPIRGPLLAHLLSGCNALMANMKHA